VIADSDSIVSVPLFDGSQVGPAFKGGSVQVNLRGFLQVFIEGEASGTVTGYVLGLAPAGAPPGTPGNSYTVRLIHN
jgi:hypothetical protein